MDAAADADDASAAGDAFFQACEAIRAGATTVIAPIDIVWIVDDSSSMDDEAMRIQENLNAFAGEMDRLSLDYRVVMITDGRGWIWSGSDAGPVPPFVQVPPPLGTSARYRFVSEDVQSHDALGKLLSTFPRYRDFLRGDSVVHVVVVTDDESDMDHAAFRTAFESGAYLGRSFKLHAIASQNCSDPAHASDPECRWVPRPDGGRADASADAAIADAGVRDAARLDGSVDASPSDAGVEPHGAACRGELDGGVNIAENPGNEYIALQQATGGRWFSICTSDWSALFSSLTQAIAVGVRIPCRYEIPAPPAGQTLDRARVNLVYTSGAGSEQPLRNAGLASETSCARGGWYYDPVDLGRIILCPSTCTAIEGDVTGRIDIAFGCETLIF